ncbi:hypothetical protein EWM64_g2465 [Hericium alpestre]|uniref:Uncharacterized protein n=1 Tax=Hericium alpestre TaxID=135208 RepID=A0A4Z0A5M7_9AGAM|nr:hypothetical protein EWM64_g2465 [Hericium alpestre]
MTSSSPALAQGYRPRPPLLLPTLPFHLNMPSDQLNTLHAASGHSHLSTASDGTADKVVDAMEKLALQDEPAAQTTPSDTTPHPFISYTQEQLLLLSKSPLVTLPEGMPALKDWFGDWNEQSNNKKDAEPSAASSTTRDRRFRRDQEDGAEPPPRATFRSALSQPSQMGNFKHQSIRSNDRDREKDGEKDKDRDSRDRDGQERLRSLSDKYDRDRLSMPPSSNGLRRERDSAPHLTAGTSRLSQGSLTSASNRRADGKDTTKRKPGESSEDWRRGREDRGIEKTAIDLAPVSETARDPDVTLRRVFDEIVTATTGTVTATTIAAAEMIIFVVTRTTTERARRTHGAGGTMDDGTRGWPLVGSFVTVSFGIRNGEIGRDPGEERGSRVTGNPTVRATVGALDERDGRPKRGGGRDKRDDSGDEGKGRTERRDRDRGEKEPAWMDAYVPSGASGGILGGKTSDGELDGIQAWKKGMKEKEQKEKEKAADESRNKSDLDSPVVQQGEAGSSTMPMGNQMDEIQLFKMMMKREEDKKRSDSRSDIAGESPLSGVATDALGGTATNDAISASGKPTTPSFDLPKPTGSRFFPNPSPTDAPLQSPSLERNLTGLIKSPVPAQFNPPPGSRLLAFGSRTPSATSNSAKGSVLGGPPSAQQQHPGLQPVVSSPFSPDSRSDAEILAQMRADPSRSQRDFSPFEQQLRTTYTPEEREALIQQEILRRQTGVSMNERGQLNDHPNAYSDVGGNHLGVQPSFSLGSQSPSFESGLSGNGLGGAVDPRARGSRFAKFFDGKPREMQTTAMPKTQGIHAQVSPSPLAHQRGEMGGMNDFQTEGRTMEDIFAMLQNSTQAQRLTPLNSSGQMSSFGNGHYGPSSSSLPPAQQHHQNIPAGRGGLDILYDNRMDDRFVPDGMVPGLRSAPPPRSRDTSGPMYQEQLDDLAFSVHPRLQPQQRNVEQMYSGSVPSMYSQQSAGLRNSGPPLQQQPFRNGTSPIPNQNPMQSHLSQRIPPGLANLGVRPPHEPSQFIGGPGNLAMNGPGQPPFNNFAGGAGIGGYAGNPQLRGPPSAPHQLQQNLLAHNNMAGLPLKQDLRPDLRGPSQAQLLGMGNGVGPGMRGAGAGAGAGVAAGHFLPAIKGASRGLKMGMEGRGMGRLIRAGWGDAPPLLPSLPPDDGDGL